VTAPVSPSPKWRATSIAVVVALLAACAPAPSAIAPLASNEFGEFALLVFDRSQLVVSATGRQGGEGSIGDEVIARPDRMELEVAWTGGACSHRPTLSVSGDAGQLRLELDASPTEWSLFPVACPAIGLLFRATLTLTAPVEQSAVTLVVND
jgi:hypothetical protein